MYGQMSNLELARERQTRLLREGRQWRRGTLITRSRSTARRAEKIRATARRATNPV